MSEEDFIHIEAKLSITLPNEYKEAILDYPFTTKFEHDVIENSLMRSSKSVILMNLELRKNGFFNIDWPDSFFAIGNDSAGNNYFYDLRSPEAKLYYADHDEIFDQNNLDELIAYENIKEFIDDQLEYQEDVLEEELND